MRTLILTLLLVAISSCATRRMPPPWSELRGTPAADSTRKLPQGEVVGFADSASTYAYLGVPYAAPPVGPLRWKAPRPAPSFQHLDAVKYGAQCPQISGPLGRGTAGEVVGSEDCLTLNVSTPAGASSGKFPVMVWVHGGGNSIGTANTYAVMRNLAAKYQVIVVAPNYRLGVLGWFHHAAITGGSEATPEDASGNFGTLDLIAALHWVHDHIERFGGDAENVTVFGESAGGFNTFSLLAAPLARGLFHRAIVQSGVPSTRTIAEAENFTDAPDPGMAISSSELALKVLVADGRASNRTEAKAALAGMKSAELETYLRSKTPQQLISPLAGAPFGMYLAPALLRDGTVLPIAPIIEVLADAAQGNHVPVLLGTNRDEWKLFMAFNPVYVGKRFGLFPFIRDQAAYDRDAALVSDNWKWLGTDAPAKALTQSQGNSVFAYRFDWDEEPDRMGTPVSKLIGAGHGLEIGFVFDDVEGEFDPFGIVTDENKASRAELSAAMSRYWANFAKTGKPGRGGVGLLPELPEWAPYGAENQFMVLDTTAGGGLRMERGAQTPEAIEQRIWSDPTITDLHTRCQVYARLFAGFAKAAGGWTEERRASLHSHCPNETLEALMVEPEKK